MLPIDQLIVTQHHLRVPKKQIEEMACFVAAGGFWTRSCLEQYAISHSIRQSPSIQVSLFEDGKKFLHDGHHRTVATFLGGRSYLDEREYEVKSWTYADYLEINFPVGWLTPFDPRTHVRHADFGNWKKTIQLLGLVDQAQAIKVIEEQKYLYLEPRRYETVAQLVAENHEQASRCQPGMAVGTK